MIALELSLPASLNEYSQAERTHAQKGAEMKRDMTELAYVEVLSQINKHGLKIEKWPVQMAFQWRCPNKKKDPDNISFAKKFILDGMQQAGLIPNDGWTQIASFHDDFIVDKDNPRVIVVITW